MSVNTKRNYIVVNGISSHEKGEQKPTTMYLSYKDLRRWGYTEFSVHLTATLNVLSREAAAKGWLIAEVVVRADPEPEWMGTAEDPNVALQSLGV